VEEIKNTKKDIDQIILGKRIIGFHKIFADITGNINSALFLSQAYFWSDKGKKKKGWFYKTQKDWNDETGLTRYQQEYCRKVLREKGILLEKKEGNPYQLFFKIDFDRVRQLILEVEETEDEEETDENSDTTGLGCSPTPSLDSRETSKAFADEPLPEGAGEPLTLYTESTREKAENTLIKPKTSSKSILPVCPENGHEPILNNGVSTQDKQKAFSTFTPAVSQKELIPAKLFPRICREKGLTIESDKFWKDDIKKLTLAYGGTSVVDAFQRWVDIQVGDIKYPVGKFCKVASSYIQNLTEAKKEHPDLQALCISLYKLGDNPFTGKYKSFLNTLLDSYKFQEIEKAYKDFINGKDDYDMKFAAKNFTEGAAETIILTNREESERKRLQLYQMNEAARMEREAIESEPIPETVKEEL